MRRFRKFDQISVVDSPACKIIIMEQKFCQFLCLSKVVRCDNFNLSSLLGLFVLRRIQTERCTVNSRSPVHELPSWVQLYIWIPIEL